MALVLADRVKESSNSTGSGPFVLGGAAAGYQTLSAGIGNGNSSYFAAWDGATKWLVFRGTFTSAGNTVSVDAVLAQSAGFAGFTGPFTIWGDSPALLMNPLLQMIATAGQIEITGQVVVDGFLGVGTGATAPRGVVDFVGNVNADGGVTGVIQNKNAGANASVYFAVQNDLGHGLTIGTYSSGQPVSGSIGYTRDGVVLVSSCAGGMTIGLQSGSGLLAFTTAGANRLIIDQTGNVGIGRVPSAPYYTVDIYRNQNGPSAVMNTNASNGASASASIGVGNDASHQAILRANSSTLTASGLDAADRATLLFGGAGGMAIGAVPLIFGSGSTEFARFDANGYFVMNQNVAGFLQTRFTNTNAGAGNGVISSFTNDVAHGLQLIVYSSTTGSGVGDASLVQATGNGGLWVKTTTNSQIKFQVNNGNVCGLWDSPSGYLGVGPGYDTTPPTFGLDVTKNIAGGGTARFRNGSGATNAVAHVRLTWDDANNTFELYQTSPNYAPSGPYLPGMAALVSAGANGMLLYTTNTGSGGIIVLNPQAGGNSHKFGSATYAIGNPTPLGGWTGSSMLSIYNNWAQCIACYSNLAGGDIIRLRTDQTSTYLQMFYYSGTNVGWISTNGSTCTFGSASDLRLKENFKPAGDAGAILDAIEVEEFDWKETGIHESHGIIAQKLHKIFPLAVREGTDELNKEGGLEHSWGYDASKLVPLLIHEVQSLRKRIAQMDNRVSEITRRGVLH